MDDLTSGTDYCVPAELETGNASTYIEWPAHSGANAELPPGDSVKVQMGPADAGLEDVLHGRHQFDTGIDEVLVEATTGAGFMNLGTAIFLRYDVYFNPQSGRVAASARTDTRSPTFLPLPWA